MGGWDCGGGGSVGGEVNKFRRKCPWKICLIPYFKAVISFWDFLTTLLVCVRHGYDSMIEVAWYINETN